MITIRQHIRKLQMLDRQMDVNYLTLLHTLTVMQEQREREHLRNNRDELSALWDDQFAVLSTPMPEEQRDRLWKANRDWWLTIIKVKNIPLFPIGDTHA